MPAGTKQESSTSRIFPADREHDFCRYIRLDKGVSTYNIASTAKAEGSFLFLKAG